MWPQEGTVDRTQEVEFLVLHVEAEVPPCPPPHSVLWSGHGTPAGSEGGHQCQHPGVCWLQEDLWEPGVCAGEL